MTKYKIKLYLNKRTRTPLYEVVREAESDEQIVKYIKRRISTRFYCIFHNCDNNLKFSYILTPNSADSKILGYIPVLRNMGGNNSSGFFFVGVKPVTYYAYKKRNCAGHFPEFSSQTLDSELPHTRGFSSNLELAIKYYKKCCIDLNKKNILLNLSRDLFFKFNCNVKYINKIWEVYNEISIKNENTKIIF